MRQITLYDKFDRVNCPVALTNTSSDFIPYAATDDDCGGRGTVLNDTCLCDPPYFGARCALGCAGTSVLSAYGQDFASSLTNPGLYGNLQTCEWVLQPTAANANLSSIYLQIESLSTETSSDYVYVYHGADTTDSSALIGSYSGSYASFSLVIPYPVASVKFTSSEWNPSGLRGKLWTGFTATYHALGCSAGSYHRRAQNGSLSVWSCEQCLPGMVW